MKVFKEKVRKARATILGFMACFGGPSTGSSFSDTPWGDSSEPWPDGTEVPIFIQRAIYKLQGQMVGKNLGSLCRRG
jgi:hypothetical protein